MLVTFCLCRSYRIKKSIYALKSYSNWSAPNYSNVVVLVHSTSPEIKGLGQRGSRGPLCLFKNHKVQECNEGQMEIKRYKIRR